MTNPQCSIIPRTVPLEVTVELRPLVVTMLRSCIRAKDQTALGKLVQNVVGKDESGQEY